MRGPSSSATLVTIRQHKMYHLKCSLCYQALVFHSINLYSLLDKNIIVSTMMLILQNSKEGCNAATRGYHLQLAFKSMSHVECIGLIVLQMFLQDM